MKLSRYLQLAYSAERAAAFAYQGHAGSVKDANQKKLIYQIELDEWKHRDNLMRMMNKMMIVPSKYFEIKYYIIGKFISLSCYLIGYFMPMYFAGRLESGNVNEYINITELIKGTPIEDELDCLIEMAKVEKDHEMYFLEAIIDHRFLPLFQSIFKWGPGFSYNEYIFDRQHAG